MASAASDVRFREAFHAHYQAVARYCLRRLPRQQVDDAVSRVFAVMWRKVEDMPPSESTLPWLYRIASYEVSTLRRTNRRSTSLQIKLNGLPRETYPGPEVQVVRSAEHEEALAALATLSEQDREVILLRSYEELSFEHIAQVFDCSEQAARQRLSRALRRLRKAAGITEVASGATGTAERGEL